MSEEDTTTVSILLVDDHPDDLLLLKRMLAAPHRRLVTASSGAEALRRVAEEEFAAIVMDVMMPGMDGFELAGRIRAKPETAEVPILFLTGIGDDTRSVYKAYDVGAVDILTKPPDPDVLRAKLRVFVDLFEKDRRIKQLNARRYESLVDSISHIVWMSDRNGRITHVNRRWTEYAGTELEGTRSWLDIVHPDDLPACDAAWQRSLETGEPFEADCRLRRADGTYRWHLCRATPDTSEESLRSGWLGTHTDLDELVRARMVAEDSRRRLVFLAEVSGVLSRSLDVVRELQEAARRAVTSIADVCVVNVCDIEQKAVLARAAIRGATTPAAPWDRVIELLPSNVSQGVLVSETDGEGLRRVCRTEEGMEAMRALRVRGAIVVPVVSREKNFGVLALLSLSDGKSYDADDLAMAVEIGRRAGEAVDNALVDRAAERAIQARDEFLSVASHELRTPLSALLLQLGSLERLVAADPRATLPGGKSPTKKVAAALRNTDRLAKLVDNLLDVSRLTSTRVQLNLEDCELSAIVCEVTDRFAEEARAARCHLLVSATAESRGLWDRLRMEQVVTNLLSNALKYGSGSPVEVRLESDATSVRISVRDHGIGIQAEDQARVWNRFERAVSVRHYGGLGLGLYIVKQIIEAHGGSVRIHSNAGDGTTFEVEVPRAHAVTSTDPGDGVARRDIGASLTPG